MIRKVIDTSMHWNFLAAYGRVSVCEMHLVRDAVNRRRAVKERERAAEAFRLEWENPGMVAGDDGDDDSSGLEDYMDY